MADTKKFRTPVRRLEWLKELGGYHSIDRAYRLVETEEGPFYVVTPGGLIRDRETGDIRKFKLMRDAANAAQEVHDAFVRASLAPPWFLLNTAPLQFDTDPDGIEALVWAPHRGTHRGVIYARPDGRLFALVHGFHHVEWTHWQPLPHDPQPTEGDQNAQD